MNFPANEPIPCPRCGADLQKARKLGASECGNCGADVRAALRAALEAAARRLNDPRIDPDSL